jgi:hypothetical protein
VTRSAKRAPDNACRVALDSELARLAPSAQRKNSQFEVPVPLAPAIHVRRRGRERLEGKSSEIVECLANPRQMRSEKMDQKGYRAWSNHSP